MVLVFSRFFWSAESLSEFSLRCSLRKQVIQETCYSWRYILRARFLPLKYLFMRKSSSLSQISSISGSVFMKQSSWVSSHSLKLFTIFSTAYFRQLYTRNNSSLRTRQNSLKYWELLRQYRPTTFMQLFRWGNKRPTWFTIRNMSTRQISIFIPCRKFLARCMISPTEGIFAKQETRQRLKSANQRISLESVSVGISISSRTDRNSQSQLRSIPCRAMMVNILTMVGAESTLASLARSSLRRLVGLRLRLAIPAQSSLQFSGRAREELELISVRNCWMSYQSFTFKSKEQNCRKKFMSSQLFKLFQITMHQTDFPHQPPNQSSLPSPAKFIHISCVSCWN